MKQHRSYGRVMLRHSVFLRIAGVLACTLAVLGIISLVALKGQRNTPLGIVIAHDPVVIMSFDTERKNVVVLTIPSDTHLSDSSYSLDALWHLGDLDHKDAGRLGEALKKALGAPIVWYIGQNTSSIEPFFPEGRQMGTGVVGELLSVQTLLSLLGGSYRTNISLPRMVSLYLSARTLTSDHIKTIDISKSSAITKVTLADGSSVGLLDNDRVDALFDRVFEDSSIRKESRTVAIFNTGLTPSAGSTVGRLLGHVGVLVTVVGNQDTPVKNCVIGGTKEALGSLTAAFIQSIYGCSAQINDKTERSDITMQIGDGFMKGE